MLPLLLSLLMAQAQPYVDSEPMPAPSEVVWMETPDVEEQLGMIYYNNKLTFGNPPHIVVEIPTEEGLVVYRHSVRPEGPCSPAGGRSDEELRRLCGDHVEVLEVPVGYLAVPWGLMNMAEGSGDIIRIIRWLGV